VLAINTSARSKLRFMIGLFSRYKPR
jgi:hypothetical protein